MSIDTIRNEEESISGNSAVSKTSNLFFNSSKDEFDMPSIRTMEKMKEHAQFLRGKSILLQGKEEKFVEQQRKIVRYRKIIMNAIREFALDYGQDREEAASVINKFERILDEIDIDLTEDEDEIMG